MQTHLVAEKQTQHPRHSISDGDFCRVDCQVRRNGNFVWRADAGRVGDFTASCPSVRALWISDLTNRQGCCDVNFPESGVPNDFPRHRPIVTRWRHQC